MGWVDSPKFFWNLLETIMDGANAIVNISLLLPRYGTITNNTKTGSDLPHTLEILTHIDWYMDDIITAVQGWPKRQRQVFDVNIKSFKWLLLSLPGKEKD